MILHYAQLAYVTRLLTYHTLHTIRQRSSRLKTVPPLSIDIESVV